METIQYYDFLGRSVNSLLFDVIMRETGHTDAWSGLRSVTVNVWDCMAGNCGNTAITRVVHRAGLWPP